MSVYGLITALIISLILLSVTLAYNILLNKRSKEKTKQLNDERMFLKYVLEATKTNINISDTELNLQYVDPSWQKIYGNPAGRKCYEYFMNKDSPCETCGIPEALKKKAPIVYEEILPSENNRIVEVHTIPFLDSNGKWLVAEYNIDITRRKHAEDALQTNQRLESLGIMAGGIAHDFNNLLSGIFGNIIIATELSENNELTEHLLQTSCAIERARSLTGQLLTFAKGGEPVKKIEPLDSFIKKTVNFALSGSKVSCNFIIPNDLSLCEFDKNQISQVLDNLVINAKQAMPEGGKLDVFAENVDNSDNENIELKAGMFVKITVKDQGSGIPEDVLPKIFDPFFTTKPKGAGLGLATSYSIIKRHDGCMTVESEPGFGSTFTIFLPATSKKPNKSNEHKCQKHIGSGTFLLMDDQKIIRITTGKMLETLGYSVVTKEDGASAVEYFINNPGKIDAMIFDLTIPGGMGGLEAVSRVRLINTEVPVFVSSGYADDPVMAHPKEYGFTARITKPFTKNELIDTLNRHMKR